MTLPRLVAPLAAGLALVLLTACGSSGGAAEYDVAPAGTSAATETGAPAVEEAPVEEAPVEQAPAAPAPEPPAPAATFEVGDPFDESCSVAWPSAPTVTATDIQIAAYCPGVPSSYPLVLVVYGDPALPITPSTSSFRAIGEVYGTGQSGAGMPYLIVLASEVRL